MGFIGLTAAFISLPQRGRGTAGCQVKCNTFYRQNQAERDNPNIYEDGN